VPPPLPKLNCCLCRWTVTWQLRKLMATAWPAATSTVACIATHHERTNHLTILRLILASWLTHTHATLLIINGRKGITTELVVTYTKQTPRYVLFVQGRLSSPTTMALFPHSHVFCPPLPFPPFHSPRKKIGHFIWNFVQFYACFQWILEAVSQG